jgi:radical SAM superfamily enzyme YgiQ (UPF0313 family)
MDKTRPRILLIYPRFARSHLLNYEFMAPFFPGKRGVMPPTGLLLIAALFEEDGWEVRIHDENVDPVDPAVIDWADVVGLSGMHQQRPRLTALIDECNGRGKLTLVGGSSVSICPEYYPRADVLHVGEMGDATKEMLAFLRASLGKPRPAAQVVFKTDERTALDDQPMPALHLVDVNRYLLVPVQFSVGCPFTCEFCDIPMIYGRVARLKSPERVLRELEALYAYGFIGAVMFVDDNIIANRKALKGLLPKLIEWQKERDYPFAFTSEASVNLARDKEILELLRQARFTHMFVGVESPDKQTLVQISKKQNVLQPVLDALRAIEESGIEVLIGIIFGFDTDTPETGQNITRFIGEANAPIIHFNMLAALPKTALWSRMEREGRLIREDEEAPALDSLLGCLNTNVRTRLPHALVKRMLVDTMRAVYSPEQVYARYTWNLENVYGRQVFGRPPSRTWAHIKYMAGFSARAMARVMRVVLTADYRRLLWRFLWRALGLRLRGRIPSMLDVLFRVVPTAHHLILWNRHYLAEFVPLPAAATERTAPGESALAALPAALGPGGPGTSGEGTVGRAL